MCGNFLEFQNNIFFNHLVKFKKCLGFRFSINGKNQAKPSQEEQAGDPFTKEQSS